MRTTLALILTSILTTLFSTAGLAQDTAAVAAAEAACGPKHVNFNIENDDTQHAVGQPEAGKALVYIVQEIGSVACIGACITTKIAMDGGWIGANRDNSYFSFNVDPGEHHLCANWQSRFGFRSSVAGLLHFTAEPGKVYFFRTRTIGHAAPDFFDIEPIDSDQGRLFVASTPMSVSHPKK